jgi:hypothetical protein
MPTMEILSQLQESSLSSKLVCSDVVDEIAMLTVEILNQLRKKSSLQWTSLLKHEPRKGKEDHRDTASASRENFFQ